MSGPNVVIPAAPGGDVGGPPVVQVSRPTHGTTRASSALGSLVDPWTDTITVAAGESVRYTVTLSAQCAGNETMYMGLRVNGVLIDSCPFYTAAHGGNENRVDLSGVHTPAEPGELTLEVLVASNSGSTVTLSSVAATTLPLLSTRNGVSSMQLEKVLAA